MHTYAPHTISSQQDVKTFQQWLLPTSGNVLHQILKSYPQYVCQLPSLP